MNMKLIGPFAAALLLAGCVMGPVPARAVEARIIINVGQKTVTATNVMSVKERISVRLVNLGDATATNLTVQVLNQTNQLMAVQSAWTNVGATNAVGQLDLNTVPLVTAFSNRTPQGVQTFTLVVWDTAINQLVANDKIAIQNNPYGSYPAPASLTNYTYITTDSVTTGAVISGTWNTFAFTPAASNAIVAMAGGSTGGATQWVFLAQSSPTNYLAASTRTGSVLYVQGTITNGGGGGAGTLTNFLWGTNSTTAQGIVAAGSNNTLRSAGGTNYLDGALFATGTPLYVQSETNASARLSSNVWAAADSSTNYVRRTGGSYNSASWVFEGLVADGTAPIFSIDQPTHQFAFIVNASPLVYATFDTSAFTFSGTDMVLSGGSFMGAGSGLTDLNYTSITNAPSTTNNALLNASNNFTSASVNKSAGGFIGNGAGLTNLNGMLPVQTSPFALVVLSRSESHGTNLTAFYASGADALLSLSSVTATNAINFEGVVNSSTATLSTPTFAIYNVKIPELATNFTRLRWRAMDNQGTTAQPTLVLSWNNAASFATMTSVVSAAATATSNGYAITGWTNGWQGRTVQIVASFTGASTNNANTRFQGFEASQAQPLFTVEP